MTFKQLLNKLMGFGERGEIIDLARTELDSIGNVFRTTISKYKAHAVVTKNKAKEFNAQAQELRKQEMLARQAEVDLLLIADEAERMASQIEKTIGFTGMENAA